MSGVKNNVTDNTIYNYATSGHGISLNYASENQVIKNSIITVADYGYGISIYSYSDNNEITENNIRTFGFYSYGIYMYHYPLLYGVILALNAAGVKEGGLYDLVLYTATIGGTALLAAVSHRWFESPFLQWKTRFAVVQTER